MHDADDLPNNIFNGDDTHNIPATMLKYQNKLVNKIQPNNKHVKNT